MEWSLQIKRVTEVIVKAVMSLYKEATTKISVGFVDKLSVKLGVHQSFISSSLLFTIVMNVMTEDARNGVLHEILYADIS